MSSAATPAISSFDAENPAGFYLLEKQARLEPLADAVLVVQGVELPAHSQVLSLQSNVLLDMFSAVAGQSGQSGQAKAVLREPFAESSLFEVALFLRFAHRPADFTPTNLTAVRGSLLSLLRLAHQLDAPQIMQATAQHMCGCVDAYATCAELLAWAEGAEQCCHPDLQTCCLLELARRLAGTGDNLAATLSSAAGLADRFERSTLATLLSLLAKASGTDGASRLQAITPAAVAEAQGASANHGSFEWAFERYSQLPAGVGEVTCSPYFMAAGLDWRFQIYPGGDREEAAGHLSVSISPKQSGVTVSYSVEVVSRQENYTRQSREPRLFCGAKSECWGFPKLITAEELRTQPSGYLRGDRLVLRATVEVTGRDVQPMAD